MTYTHEEIISALTVIKETCESHKDGTCNDCELYSYHLGTCGVTDISPAAWDIGEEIPKWRAFR